MLYQTINFHDFQAAFNKMGRGDQFSYEGLRMLYDYIEDLSNDIGQNIELDVIGLCCQYAEYTLDEFLVDYSIDGIESIEDLDQALRDGDIDCVIAHDIYNDIILVDSDCC